MKRVMLLAFLALIPAAYAEESSPRHFIKGDLADVGMMELVSPFDHFGVSVGPRVLGFDFFTGVTPRLGLYFENYSLGLHAPLNILTYEAGSSKLGPFRIRREDWDERADYAKILRFLTMGHKEERFYFSVGSGRPETLGHGMLLSM